MRDAPDMMRLTLNVPIALAKAASLDPDVASILRQRVMGALWEQLDATLAKLPEKMDEYQNGDDEPAGTPV